MATAQEISAKLDEVKALLAQLPAAPAPSPTPAPAPAPALAWPAALNCLGGTTPSTIGIPDGDNDPHGATPEPARSRKLANLPDGSIGVFGDSIIQATSENLIHPAAYNCALGGQSLRRMINGLRDYSFMRSAGAGVILCGVNDLSNVSAYGPRTNGSAVNTVLYMYGNQLKNWLTGKWVICHLLPRNEPMGGPEAPGYNAQVAAVNAQLEARLAGCAAQIAFVPVNPAFVDSNGQMKPQYVIDDGQHLNKAGGALLASGIRSALASLGL